MKTVYLLLLKIIHQGTVKNNVYFQYIKVKKTQTFKCISLGSHFLMKNFNGQRMTVFPKALKRKISDCRGRIYYHSVADLIEWKCSPAVSATMCIGKNLGSSMHSHTDRPDRHLIDK